MENIALNIKDKLVRLTDLYEQFQRVLILEQELIVASKTDKLRELVKKKEKIAEQIQITEEDRIKFLDEIAKVTGRQERFKDR